MKPRNLLITDANSIDRKFVRNWMNQKSQIKEELSKYYLRGETID